MADVTKALADQLRATRQILAEYPNDAALQLEARAIDRLLADESSELSDGRVSLDLSTFGVGAPWPLERIFAQVLRELGVDPTYHLLLLSAAIIAGADLGQPVKFADCIETMRALADAAGIDLSELEVIVEEGGKAS